MLESLCEQVPWRGGQSSLSSLTLKPCCPLLPSLGGSKSVSLNCVLSPFTPQDSVRARLNKEKKYSSTHQNTDTSFPNQETLTSHLYKPTHSEEKPQ